MLTMTNAGLGKLANPLVDASAAKDSPSAFSFYRQDFSLLLDLLLHPVSENDLCKPAGHAMSVLVPPAAPPFPKGLL